jgi:hypothetical protein
MVGRLKSFVALALLGCCSYAFGGDDLPENAYIWKADKVYRFDYSKTITVAPPNTTEGTDVRKTTIAGVLIFEVTEVTPDGALAKMRIDAPRITLPPIEFYSSQFENPELQKDKDLVVAKAMQGTIKSTIWSVKLKPDGSIIILQRTPADFTEWLKDTKNAAGWHTKTMKKLGDMVENDLGFRTPGEDHETFLFLGKKPIDEMPLKIRPWRSACSVVSNEEDKLTVKFTRSVSDPPPSFTIPSLDAEGTVTIALKNVSATEGKAVFDKHVGNLDTLSEEYTVQSRLTFRNDSLEREIKVQYTLKRLAPPIIK